MGFYSDLDGGVQHPYLAVDEAGKTLHFVQNGLDMKLNSWSVP